MNYLLLMYSSNKVMTGFRSTFSFLYLRSIDLLLYSLIWKQKARHLSGIMVAMEAIKDDSPGNAMSCSNLLSYFEFSLFHMPNWVDLYIVADRGANIFSFLYRPLNPSCLMTALKASDREIILF